jgi:hypothetical protein
VCRRFRKLPVVNSCNATPPCPPIPSHFSPHRPPARLPVRTHLIYTPVHPPIPCAMLHAVPVRVGTDLVECSMLHVLCPHPCSMPHAPCAMFMRHAPYSILPSMLHAPTHVLIHVHTHVHTYVLWRQPKTMPHRDKFLGIAAIKPKIVCPHPCSYPCTVASARNNVLQGLISWHCCFKIQRDNL